MNHDEHYVALVLAADRAPNDPVASKTGVACKAFAPIGGKPMIIRVLDALTASNAVKSIILCGPPKALLPQCPELQQRIENGQVIWIENQNSPSRSAEQGLKLVDPATRVLLTTADHALLTPEIVRYFLQASIATDCDTTVGVIQHETIKTTFPNSRRTVIRLRDGGFCGCNLFAFNRRGRELVTFWQHAEDQRKRPWRLVSLILGWKAVISYLFGSLTLAQALRTISTKTGVHVQAITLPFPQAGIDIDKVDDLLLVESFLEKYPSTTKPTPD
jgi:CTP:molybdopterin cytidylyltransferase MocA